jgi:hypothetical protein
MPGQKHGGQASLFPPVGNRASGDQVREQDDLQHPLSGLVRPLRVMVLRVPYLPDAGSRIGLGGGGRMRTRRVDGKLSPRGGRRKEHAVFQGLDARGRGAVTRPAALRRLAHQ